MSSNASWMLPTKISLLFDNLAPEFPFEFLIFKFLLLLRFLNLSLRPGPPTLIMLYNRSTSYRVALLFVSIESKSSMLLFWIELSATESPIDD